MTFTYPPHLLPTCDGDADVFADCDTCGEKKPVTRALFLGLECFVCEECRNPPPARQ